MSRISDGEYVLATKYTDGDPGDHWAVGFLRRRMTEYNPLHFDIVDNNGIPFRGNGFRRIQRVTQRVGKCIVDNTDEIEGSPHSLWWWKAHYQALLENMGDTDANAERSQQVNR